MFGTFQIRMMAELSNPKSPIVKDLYPVIQLVTEEAKRGIRKKVDQIYISDPHLMDGVDAKMQVFGKGLDTFNQHRARGRPRKSKTRRGRPKNA